MNKRKIEVHVATKIKVLVGSHGNKVKTHTHSMKFLIDDEAHIHTH